VVMNVASVVGGGQCVRRVWRWFAFMRLRRPKGEFSVRIYQPHHRVASLSHNAVLPSRFENPSSMCREFEFSRPFPGGIFTIETASVAEGFYQEAHVNGLLQRYSRVL